MPACPERGRGDVSFRVLNDTLLRLYSGRENKIKQITVYCENQQ